MADPVTKRCAVIDPVLDYDPDSGRADSVFADTIVDFIKARGYGLDWIIETHLHADHLTAAPYIRERLGGKTAIGEQISAVQTVFGDIFNEGECFRPDGHSSTICSGIRKNTGSGRSGRLRFTHPVILLPA